MKILSFFKNYSKGEGYMKKTNILKISAIIAIGHLE